MNNYPYSPDELPYEIVIEDRDPDKPEDRPAGNNPRIQRRKWKIWINTKTFMMFHRTNKRTNKWSQVPFLQAVTHFSYWLNSSSLLPDGGNDNIEDIYRNGKIGLNKLPISTFDLNGTFALTSLAITATRIISINELIQTIYCNNGATNITITLPNPLLCENRIYTISRINSTSTGTITIACSLAGNRVQALTGTIGVTSTISANGATGQGQGIRFQAHNGVWRRL